MEMPEDAAKTHLCDLIDAYITERITMAADAIVSRAITKITDGDVVLTFAHSYVVERLLLAAHARRTSFRVVVVDSRPQLEGRVMISRLAAKGIECAYCALNAVSYVMAEATKVFLGSAAFMSNGTAVSRVGTAVVAMTAKAHRLPVLFCCETYKFCERVQLDSICRWVRLHDECRGIE